MSLAEEILNLISLKQEGSYWDFKRQWYENGKEAELLLDIICMANTLDHHDAYIIIGVDEENDFLPYDISNDPQRRNTQMLVDFLRDKKFAGGIRPVVSVEHITGSGFDVDVIVIYDSSNTPFYLTESTRGIFPNNIYTRVQDSNTPREKSADLYIVEKLWKKRFGIDLSALERFKILLNDTEKWNCDWGNKGYAYHADFPEFQIIQADELKPGWWPAAAFYIHPKMHFAPLFLKYHDTIIYETELWCFDNFHKYLPKAENYCASPNLTFCYSYYLLDSIEGKMLTIFTNGSNDISSREPNYCQLLIFANEDEKNDYDKFLWEHFSDHSDDFITNKYQHQINQDTDDNLGGLQYSAFQVGKAALLYGEWLKSSKGLN